MESEGKIQSEIPADISRVLVVSIPANGSGPSGEPKKKRFVWTRKNHGKFVQAVNSIGFDKATPKKIMLAMNMPDELTRDIVSSHWQKYRANLMKEAKAEEHRIIVQQTPDQLENNGSTDTKIIISTERRVLKQFPDSYAQRLHVGLGCNNGSTDRLQVSAANSVDRSCSGRFLHDRRVLSHPQSFDFAQQFPSSHHNGSSNFLGNISNYAGSTVAADYLAGSCLQAADRYPRRSEFGYGSMDLIAVESDPLEFTVAELIDNIDN